MSLPTESCECYPTYSATATANGYAYVNVVSPVSLVTSEASATASSNISYEDAFIEAEIRAQNIANSAAQNDANIITQAILLSGGSNTGAGYTGPQGAAGPQGYTGFNGPTGVQGPQGAPGGGTGAGITGAQGSVGPTGANGANGIGGTTTITFALTYTTQSATTTPASSGVSLLTGVTLLSTKPNNLEVTASGNSVIITNSKPLPSGNALLIQKARACLIPLNSTILVLSASSSGTTSITNPDNMYYNDAVVTTGLNKYAITYNASTLGLFSMNCQLVSSNGFFGAPANMVGTVALADAETQFVGAIISLTFDNSVLEL